MEHTTRKHEGRSAKAIAIGMVATNGQQGDGTTTDGKIFGCGKNTDGKIFGYGKNTDGKIFGYGKNTNGQQGEGHGDFKGIIGAIQIIGGL